MNKFLVCNWKTYITSKDGAISLANSIEPSDNSKIIVCPSALHLSAVSEIIKNKNISLGSQDISISTSPQTGQSSGEQLISEVVEYTIVGHAETKAAGTTDKMVAEKIKNSFLSNITPIICLGVKDTKEEGKEIVKQFENIISGININKEIIIAYEPIAYIGADSAPSSSSIKDIVMQIKEVAKKHIELDVPVMYGGSVNTTNVEDILESGMVDGFLLGRAGVDKESLNKIIKCI